MDKRNHPGIATFLDQPNALRRPGNFTSLDFSPVLAAFDPETAFVWVNQQFKVLEERNRRSRKPLCDEDTERLAHEFARALQYRDVFQTFEAREERVDAIRKRRTKLVTRSTAESFANRKMNEERKAEVVAQRIKMEILNAFDHSQRGSGLFIYDLPARAEELAAEMVASMKEQYLESAKQEFLRLQNLAGVAAHAAGKPELRGLNNMVQILKVRRIRWMFPSKLSPTLTDLIDEIIMLDIDIAIVEKNPA